MFETLEQPDPDLSVITEDKDLFLLTVALEKCLFHQAVRP